MNALVPYSHQEKLADAIAKSRMFGLQTKEQALALMAIAEAEGLHPAVAARDYHIIGGKPSLKADAMMARFLNAGGKVSDWVLSDKEVAATFTHAQGGEVRISWTIEMAAAAGLTGKEIWKKFPRSMLRARVISEGIRTVYPGVVVGMYTPEEVEDFDVVKIKPNVVDAKFEPSPLIKKLNEAWLEEQSLLISGSRTMDELRDVFNAAYNAAYELQDSNMIKEISRLKDVKKSELEAQNV